jgi:hypothetical protein
VVAGGRRLHHFGRAGDFHYLGHGAELELQVDGGGLADGDAVALGRELLKAVGFDGEGVGAGLNGFKGVRAIGSRGGGEGGAGAFVGQRYVGIDHRRAAGVGDDTQQPGSGSLRKSRKSAAKEGEDRRDTPSIHLFILTIDVR